MISGPHNFQMGYDFRKIKNFKVYWTTWKDLNQESYPLVETFIWINQSCICDIIKWCRKVPFKKHYTEEEINCTTAILNSLQGLDFKNKRRNSMWNMVYFIRLELSEKKNNPCYFMLILWLGVTYFSHNRYLSWNLFCFQWPKVDGN